MGDKENCFEAREERKASCSLGRGDMKANEKGCKSLRKPRTGYSAGCCGRLSDEKSAQLSPAEISAKLSSLETEGLLLIFSAASRSGGGGSCSLLGIRRGGSGALVGCSYPRAR